MGDDDGRRGVYRDLFAEAYILLNERIELAGVIGLSGSGIARSLCEAACYQFLHSLEISRAEGCSYVLLHASIFRPLVLIVEKGCVNGFKPSDASGSIGPAGGVHRI